MKSSAKFMFACNTLPPSTDTTQGLYRRLLVVPFRATFTKDNMDRELRNKLKTEASGIFNKFLDGYDRLISQGRFSNSLAAEMEVEDYISDNNHVANFVLEYCELVEVSETIEVTDLIEGKHYEFTESLYLEYKNWAEAGGERPVSLVHFGKEIKKIKPQRLLRAINKASGRRQTIVKGISLLTRSKY
jgi:putative DNA primase/helicase